MTLVFEGVFDARAVVRARQELAELSDQDQVVLDISKVSDVDWCALASLAAEVVRLPSHRVSLTGYCEQHARLLSYLGLDALLEHAGEEPVAAGGAGLGGVA